MPLSRGGGKMKTAVLASRLGAKAYVVGGAGVKAAVRAAGLEVVEPEVEWGILPDAMALLEVDSAVRVVVLAFDASFCYYHVAYATRCLLENAGCALIATNRDFQFPSQRGRKLPGNGAFVAAVCASARREPDALVGKPEPFALEEIMRDAGVTDASRVLMVGDMWQAQAAFSISFFFSER